MFSIECQVGVLLKAVQSVLPAIENKSTLPILRHCLLEAEGEGLRLTGTNIEMGIRVSCAAVVGEAGQAAIDARMLCSLLLNLPSSASITLSQQPTMMVRAVCRKANYNINGMSAEEFIVWKSVNEADSLHCFTMPGTDMLRGLDSVIYAASTETARSNICGVFLKLEDGNLTMVATDTKRLAIKISLVGNSAGSGQIIVPAPFLQALRTYLERETEVAVNFTDRGIWVKLPSSSIEMHSRVLDGTYPTYTRVIPVSSDISITTDREELMEAVKRCQLVAVENSNRIVFSFAGMFLELTAEALGQQAKEEIAVTMQGEPQQCAVNGKFLLSCLESFAGKEVAIEVTSPLKPWKVFDVLEGGRDESLTVVLMPMNI